jgi:hypothetical protein
LRGALRALASAIGMLQGLFRGDWACSDATAAETARRVREALPSYLA